MLIVRFQNQWGQTPLIYAAHCKRVRPTLPSCACTKPSNSLASVLLPQPLGPMSTVHLLGLMVRLKLLLISISLDNSRKINVGRTREAVRRIRKLRGVVEYGGLQMSPPYNAR